MSANPCRSLSRALICTLILSLCALQSRGCVYFVRSPQNATVEVGSSVSFSCVVHDSSVSHWYINNMTVRTVLNNKNYSEWDGCFAKPQYCGRTLFIETVSMELNESTISCQVLHETCDGRNATLSKPATLIVKLPDVEIESSGAHLQPSSNSSQTLSSTLSHTPTPTPAPGGPPLVSFDPPYTTESKQVIDGFVQRLPLVGVSAGVFFLLGSVYGAVCAVTVMRGCQRRHRRKLKRKISIRARPDPAFCADSERENTDITTSEQPRSSTPTERVECGREMQATGTAPYQGAPGCKGTSVVPRSNETVSSIGADLDELEQVVSRQRMTETV